MKYSTPQLEEEPWWQTAKVPTIFLAIGIVVGGAGTFLYYFLSYTAQRGPKDLLTTEYFIAKAFNQALPYIIGVIVTVFVLFILYVIFNFWRDTTEIKRQKIIAQATEETEKILKQAREEATATKKMAEEAAAKTDRKAQALAEEIIGEATALKKHVAEEKFNVSFLREELEEEYGDKKRAYVDHIKALEKNLTKCQAQSTVKDEIIRWLREGNTGAAQRAQKELRNLQKKDPTPEPLK